MPPHGLAATQTKPSKTAPGVMNGARYIESLRDGREVWLHGEKIADVTRHPAFRNVVQTFAELYDLQHQAATQATRARLRGSSSAATTVRARKTMSMVFVSLTGGPLPPQRAECSRRFLVVVRP